MLWIFRTGSPWRDLPSDYGDWSNTHRRFCRWRDKGIWEKLLEVFMDESDFEWLMMDTVHQHAASARGGNQEMGRTKRGGQHKGTSGRGCAWYAAQSDGYSSDRGRLQPGGRPSDCWHARRALDCRQRLLQDSDEIVRTAQAQNMQAQIPPRKNRKHPRRYDKHLYRHRHWVENAFVMARHCHTLYQKRGFLAAAVNLRCLVMWLKIS